MGKLSQGGRHSPRQGKPDGTLPIGFMDNAKVGQLILQLRKEKGLTQQQLAEMLDISNKAVSKWECGHGAPDIALLGELSSVLGADIQKLLQGELKPNRPDTGKMDRIHFHVCPVCGNILTGTGDASISCCGRHILPLSPSSGDAGPEISIEEIDTDYYVSVSHEMSKSHYISFAAWVNDSCLWLQRLYPEQSPAFRMPAVRRNGNLYLYCIRDGLFKYPLKTLLKQRTAQM